MKLVSTLPERVGFLHVLPVFDLLVLLLVFFLVGPSLMSQSGVQVEMSVSRYQLDRQADAAVITLTRGDPAVIWLERKRVTERELIEEMARRREQSVTKPTACIRSDGDIPASYERRIAESLLMEGFRVYLLGRAPEIEED